MLIRDHTTATPASLVHGGDLTAARQMFPGAPEPFIDLSTGINPFPYPIPALSADDFVRQSWLVHETLSFAEGQLVAEGEIEVVRHVEPGKRFLPSEISADAGIRGPGQALRKRITRQEPKTG